MENILKKMLTTLLKEEDLRALGTTQSAGLNSSRSLSYKDVERLAAMQQNKEWGPENSQIWSFQINRKPSSTIKHMFDYTPYLGKQFDWDENQVIVELQNNPDKTKRIPYSPNVFLRQSGLDTFNGFVVATDEKEADKLLEDFIRVRRKADQDSAATRK